LKTAILSYARTPVGGLLGELSTLSAPELGGIAVRSSLERGRIEPSSVEGLIMGCVLPAGLGQAPARQAGFKAGLGDQVPATTVNKMCGSGLQAIILAHSTLLTGAANLMVAGGMESMSNAPYLIPGHRAGKKFGHAVLVDSMQRDGLEDAYEAGKPMGAFADEAAKEFSLSREAVDDFARSSLERAQRFQADALSQDEIVAVSISHRGIETQITSDQQPRKAKADGISRLRPVFTQDGIVTAATASSISDGAAAIALGSAQSVSRDDAPLGWIVGHSVFAGAPGKYCSAPVGAIRRLLQQLDWRVEDVTRFEINEAFAVVPMIAMKELGIAHSHLNVRGGACAIGHPIGASGARILVTLLSQLRQLGGGRGICAICLGGGEALALAVEV
jgi:acetyl-CoA C-acetyltransferase